MSRNRKKGIRRAAGTTDASARQFEGSSPAAQQAKRDKTHDAANAANRKPKAG